MYQNLALAIDIYELLLGFDHPQTADTYSKMAIAYQENGSFIAASPWIRRAFCVFYKCFGPHDDLTMSCWETLKIPYEELPTVIFEIEKQQKQMSDQQQMAIQNIQQQQMLLPPQARGGQYPQIAAFQNSQKNGPQNLMLRQ